jgi:hypothetical protein
MRPIDLFALLGLAAALSSCSGPRDAVSDHFNELEAKFTASTNEWQLVDGGSGRLWDSDPGLTSANALMVLKHRIDAERFRAVAAKIIEQKLPARPDNSGTGSHSPER